MWQVTCQAAARALEPHRDLALFDSDHGPSGENREYRGRHPASEVGRGENATVTEGNIGAVVHAFEPTPEKFTDAMVASKWWWAFMMSMHFIGLSLLIGVIGILDLRLIGFAKQLPVEPLHRLFPWALADWVSRVDGHVGLHGMPEYYTYNAAFWFKILALMLAGLNVAMFYLTGIFERVKRLGRGKTLPFLPRSSPSVPSSCGSPS